MNELRAKLVVDGVDKASGPLNNINKSMARLSHTSAAVNSKTSGGGGILSGLSGIAGIGGAIAGIGAAVSGVGLVKGIIETSAQFEDFAANLETTEGSAEKAKKALDWVSDFAVKTPYELADVTSAFVKLRAYGMEPTGGLMETLGNTSAAMGKPLMQSVEAIADAITGENERLKEFGIKASKDGGKIAYAYTDSAGKQQKKVVDANNRAMIQSTLSAIWNEKYKGAMEKRSKTWNGVMSNISDTWSRFQQRVGEFSFFSNVKSLLVGFYEALDAGKIDNFARVISGGLNDGLNAAVAGFSRLSKAVGGVDGPTLEIVAGGFRAIGEVVGYTAQQVAFLAETFNSVRDAMPNLDAVTKYLPKLGDMGVVGKYAKSVLGAGEIFLTRELRNPVTGKIKGSFEDQDAQKAMEERRNAVMVKGTRGRAVTSAAAVAGAAAAPQPVEVGGKVQIEVTAGGGAAARVTGMSSTNKAAPISVDQGITMGAM